MKLSQQDALRLIQQAAEPGDLFVGHPSLPADLEQAGRTLRGLIEALALPQPVPGQRLPRPDLWEVYAILIGFYHRWSRAEVPNYCHRPLVGNFGVYQRRTLVRENNFMLTYATDTPGVRVTIDKDHGDITHHQHVMLHRVMPISASHCLPTLDQGVRDGQPWYAYRIPDSTRSLRQLLADEPTGLGPEEWSWITLQIVQSLGWTVRHGGLDLDTVLVDRQHRWVYLTEWQADAGPKPRMGLYYTPDIRALVVLSHLVLKAPSGRPILEFFDAHRDDPPPKFQYEFELLLGLTPTPYGNRGSSPPTDAAP